MPFPNNRKHVASILGLSLVTLLVSVICWTIYRQMRQDRLDHILLQAISSGNDRVVLGALQAGANPNAKDDYRKAASPWQQIWKIFASGSRLPGPAALAVAMRPCYMQQNPLDCRRNDPVVINALLSNGADPNVRDEEGYPILLRAVQDQDVEIAKALLERGANVNVRNDEGDTALMVAVESGRSDMVALLLSRGADANARSKAGLTVIQQAQSMTTIQIPLRSVILYLLREHSRTR